MHQLNHASVYVHILYKYKTIFNILYIYRYIWCIYIYCEYIYIYAICVVLFNQTDAYYATPLTMSSILACILNILSIWGIF